MTCDQCGLCCLYYHGTSWARTADLLRWYDEGRKDILQYVSFHGPAGRISADRISREELEKVGTISGWADPRTGQDLLPCPFLERIGTNLYRCAIHATKSKTCRDFVHEDWEMFIAYRDRFLSP